MTDDMTLVRDYVATHSESAFSTLVERHAGLVHSAALRQIGNEQLAQDVTQAVFIILARKVRSFGPETILSAWLYRTTRYAAADALKCQRRRQKYERDACMEPQETSDSTWLQLSPLLDEAMSKLGDRYRAALVLRYFENKNSREIATALRIEESAAQKRVVRALEKLRALINRRGVKISASVIGTLIAANSVQAAPAGLVASASSVALSSSAAAGGASVLAKSALNLMAWAKAKAVLMIAAAVVVTGTASVSVTHVMSQPKASPTYVFDDGSILTLNRVIVDTNISFSHAVGAEFLLGNLIPSNGLHFGSIHLNRPVQKNFGSGPKSFLVAEFKLVGPNVANNPLVRLPFYRQFRIVLYGDTGIESVQEFWTGQFGLYPDGYFGYVYTTSFPRDAHWLGFRLERRESFDKGGPWSLVAHFNTKNPAPPGSVQPWKPDPSPAIKLVDDWDIVLGETTVKLIPYMTNDIWNHVVTMHPKVRSHGVELTNWFPCYVHGEDASGNWDYFASHRSLDPRFVWKFEMDFEPESNFPADSVATVKLPAPNTSLTTNVLDVPVTINFDGNWIEASIPTNQPKIALKFVNAQNAEGRSGVEGSGSWWQFSFRKGTFRWKDGNSFLMGPPPTAVTIAIVPNVHAMFYTQPRLIMEPQ